MNSREAVVLFGLAQNYFPTLKSNEHSPDAWGDVLDDVPFADARDALIALCKREVPFTSVGEIRAEARRTRAKRIDATPAIPPADLDADDPAAYIRWLRHARKAIADGELTVRELPSGGYVIPADVRRRIGGVFRRPEDAA